MQIFLCITEPARAHNKILKKLYYLAALINIRIINISSFVKEKSRIDQEALQ